MLLFCLASQLPASAQVFRVQAGSSSLIGAHGGSVGFEAPAYDGSIGAGLIDDQVQLGGVIRFNFLGYKVTAGDDTINFRLPTDVFGTGQFFYGRGLGFSRSSGKTKWAAFGGATSKRVGAPYFQAGKDATPFGLFFMEAPLSPRLNFVSRTVVADKHTFINALEFAVRPWLKTSLSAGIGGNRPYSAAAFTAERQRFTLQGSYVVADREFRRIKAEAPLSSEIYRDNLMFTMNPSSRFGFSLARQHLLSPVQEGATTEAARVHQASAYVHLAGFRLSSALYDSNFRGESNFGYHLGASRFLGRYVETGIDFTKSMPRAGASSQSFSARVREVFGPRFSLTQYLTRSNGQTAFNYGGEFNTRLLSVSVGHSATYVPFRSSGQGGPFVNVYNVMVRLRLFNQIDLSGQSYVDPTGRVRYTASTTNYLYRYAGLEPQRRQASVRISDYVVKGIVIDDEGNPVAGAALQVDGEITFTDTEGRFIVRLPRKGRETFTVLLDQFLTPAIYEVVSAPSLVDAQLESESKDVKVLLKRVTDRERVRAMMAAWMNEESSSKPSGSSSGSAGGSHLPPLH